MLGLNVIAAKLKRECLSYRYLSWRILFFKGEQFLKRGYSKAIVKLAFLFINVNRGDGNTRAFRVLVLY